MKPEFVKRRGILHKEFEKKKVDAGLDAATLQTFQDQLSWEFLVR